MASDIRIASGAAKIAFLFVKVGLSGADMGAAHLLPRIVGLAKATELLFTGRLYSRIRSRTDWVYNKVVPAADLGTVTHEFAARLAQGPAFALAKTKGNAQSRVRDGSECGARSEAQAQAICMQHPDYREAYQAFVEKRPPRFK